MLSLRKPSRSWEPIIKENLFERSILLIPKDDPLILPIQIGVDMIQYSADGSARDVRIVATLKFNLVIE